MSSNHDITVTRIYTPDDDKIIQALVYILNQVVVSSESGNEVESIPQTA